MVVSNMIIKCSHFLPFIILSFQFLYLDECRVRSTLLTRASTDIQQSLSMFLVLQNKKKYFFYRVISKCLHMILKSLMKAHSFSCISEGEFFMVLRTPYLNIVNKINTPNHRSLGDTHERTRLLIQDASPYRPFHFLVQDSNMHLPLHQWQTYLSHSKMSSVSPK